MTRHADLVAELVAEGKTTGRFRATVIPAILAYYDDHFDVEEDDLDGEMLMSELPLPRRIPDAYEVREEDHGLLLRLWEVEVTSLLALQPAKLWDYADFWDAAQEHLWLHFEVWTVDQLGARRQVDLEGAWLDLITRPAA